MYKEDLDNRSYSPVDRAVVAKQGDGITPRLDGESTAFSILR